MIIIVFVTIFVPTRYQSSSSSFQAPYQIGQFTKHVKLSQYKYHCYIQERIFSVFFMEFCLKVSNVRVKLYMELQILYLCLKLEVPTYTCRIIHVLKKLKNACQI